MGLRSIQYLEPGSVKKLFFDHPNVDAAVTFIATDQDPGQGVPLSPWRLRFFVQGGDDGEQSGFAYVGSVRTLPWNSGGDRVVAIACVPGARQWAVDGRPEQANYTSRLRVDLISSKCCGTYGVQAIPGISLPNPQSIRIASGVSGVVVVPGILLGWAAQAGLVDASARVQMEGFPLGVPIVIPAGSAAGDSYGEASGVFSTITFTDTISYTVDYLLPGEGTDVF
jgi:hypothetical protein